ncbi:MAG TPA: hypothetical protein VHE78_16045, partial [Gemmatimonadaceae bacterium]|nr:hypothetical protein [Gemmatimonadaceae bacterium]
GSKLVRLDRMDISRQPSRSEEAGVETLALSATILGFAIPPEPVVAAPAIATRDTVPRRLSP